MATTEASGCEWFSATDMWEPKSGYEKCNSGKPAIHRNCGITGPVCEDHKCRCSKSILEEESKPAEQKLIEKIFTKLGSLSQDQRKRFFDLLSNKFCFSCGSNSIPCHCQHDE